MAVATQDLRALDPQHVEYRAPVVEQQHVAGLHVLDQVGIIEPHPPVVTEGAGSVQNELLIGLDPDRTGRKLADADLGALQVRHDAHGSPGGVRRGTQRVHALTMIIGRAVGKVDADHIHPGGDQFPHALGVAGRRTQRGDDLGRALERNRHPAARCSSISTAGNFLPSRNSRKAPPAVEM